MLFLKNPFKSVARGQSGWQHTAGIRVVLTENQRLSWKSFFVILKGSFTLFRQHRMHEVPLRPGVDQNEGLHIQARAPHQEKDGKDQDAEEQGGGGGGGERDGRPAVLHTLHPHWPLLVEAH